MAHSISTERPRTPPRSSETEVEGFPPSFGINRQQIGSKQTYFGHITDLVYPIQNAESAIKWQIPAAYREAEAVDSSLLLGQGASFSASLQRLPAAAERTEVFTDLGSYSITQSSPSAPRPKYVVYKTARIAFGNDGQPLHEYKRAMRSVLTEFHALIYPPLLENKNIIDFLGFAWGSNPFSPSHKLPAIIVEYAEHGTLANVLTLNPKLLPTQRQFLALDVAEGLSALHHAGLVHGDIKADNILICTHPDRQYIAKIADFGFSIVRETESAQIYMSGTRPWMAPEVLKGPVTIENLAQTDVYSLGLLCWVIFLGGESPVDFISLDQNESKVAIFESMKADGSLLEVTVDVKRWLAGLIHARYDQSIERALDASLEKVRQAPASSKLNIEEMEKHRPLLYAKMFNQMLLTSSKDSFLQRLLMVFRNSLSLKAKERKLEVVIAELKVDLPSFSSSEPQQTTPTAKTPGLAPMSTVPSHGADNKADSSHGQRSSDSTQTALNKKSEVDRDHKLTNTTTGKENPTPVITWDEQGFMHNWLSWQKMKELAPSIQNFVYGALTEDRPSNLFLFSALHMVGYACPKDTQKSLDYLRRSANMGNIIARAYLFRIYRTFSPQDADPSTIPGREYLYDYAILGSRIAMLELRCVASNDEFQRCHRYSTDVKGGVGASWLNQDQMLNGITQSQWIKDDFSLKQISNVASPATLIVNKRGDTILHFTAMCGRLKPFKTLVETYKVDINIRNPLGETPTLAACRSGHGGIVILCLKNYGADASLAAVNGETPLHWLCQSEDASIEPLTADLIKRGGNVEAATREKVMHSYYPGTLDMDFSLPGTPLHWAVHRNRPHIVSVLLKHDANPENAAPGAVQSPLLWAAYWHNHDCLKVMIEHQESKVTTITTEGKPDLRHAVMYGPLVDKAIKGADKFAMILRHGVDWLTNLHKTLDLLREKTKMINFSTRFHGSTLYYAVKGAHDEVVEYMFQHEWLIDTINKPVGDAKRTPFLEAVRWNRRHICELLRDKGADVRALAANPFQPEKQNWFALHILAHEGHDKDVSLAGWLVENGLPVDGRKGSHEASIDTNISSLTLDNLKAGIYSCETAFTVAVRRNAFNLANELLRLGANPNTLSFSSGMFTSSYPLTTLGHLIISNARYSTLRLEYLLDLPTPVDFVVEPERKVTALHRAAMANADVSRAFDIGESVKREEFDFETNTDILQTLLMKWKDPKELNVKCWIKGDTALHLAARNGNVGAVEALLRAGADGGVLNDDMVSPKALARELAVGNRDFEQVSKAFG